MIDCQKTVSTVPLDTVADDCITSTWSVGRATLKKKKKIKTKIAGTQVRTRDVMMILRWRGGRCIFALRGPVPRKKFFFLNFDAGRGGETKNRTVFGKKKNKKRFRFRRRRCQVGNDRRERACVARGGDGQAESAAAAYRVTVYETRWPGNSTARTPAEYVLYRPTHSPSARRARTR